MSEPGSSAAGGIAAIEIAPLGRTSAAAVLYRRGRRLHVTLIAKATFTFVPNGTMQLADPEEILADGAQVHGDPGASALAALDTSPIRERTDVLFAGHAYAPRGFPATSVSVRISVARGEQVLLNKVLHVYGDRSPPNLQPAPFHRMPIVYERAFGGPGSPANPVGIGVVSPRGPQPNISFPEAWRNTAEPAGFGPIPASWPARSRLLSPEAAEGLRGPVPVIDAIDPAYFQAAPGDQRIEYLRGDEWILLENLHVLHARMVTRLPSAWAEARIYGLEEGFVAVPMSADTLFLDGDAERCSVTWRGSYPIQDEAMLGKLRAAAGVATMGSPIAWTINLTEGRSTTGVGTTTMVLPDAAATSSLKAPFSVARPGEGHAAPPIPGAPWSPVPAPPPIAPSSSLDAQTLVHDDATELPEALRRILEAPSAPSKEPKTAAEEPPEANKPVPEAPKAEPPSRENGAWPWASPPPSQAPTEEAKPRAVPTRTPAAPPLNTSLYERFTKKKH